MTYCEIFQMTEHCFTWWWWGGEPLHENDFLIKRYIDEAFLCIPFADSKKKLFA